MEELRGRRELPDVKTSQKETKEKEPYLVKPGGVEKQKEKPKEELKKEPKKPTGVTIKTPESKVQQAKRIMSEAEIKKQGGKMNLKTDARSVNFGVIGFGQGGSRIAEKFHQLGYPACAGNTAKQDLAFINIPEENKLFIDFALGGVGKDLALGQEAFLGAKDQVVDLVKRAFGNNVECLLAAVGGGGGTGSGAAPELVKLLYDLGLPVGIIYTLPMASEGTTTQANALKTLSKLAQLAKQEILTTLIVADNSKIEALYPNLSQAQFWKKANSVIVDTLNLFNTISAQDTEYDTLDPMDFAKIYSTGNCTIYGETEVKDFMEEQALADAMVHDIEKGMLAEGFNLKQAVNVGVIITGSKKVLDQLPRININFAFSMLTEHIGGAGGIFRGIYAEESDKDTLTVYSMFSGLGLPKERIEDLIAKSEKEEKEVEKKIADKSKMDVVDIPQPTQNQNVYQQMKSRRSPFGKMVRHSRGRG
jgi:cell division GTPase FtsZ